MYSKNTLFQKDLYNVALSFTGAYTWAVGHFESAHSIVCGYQECMVKECSGKTSHPEHAAWYLYVNVYFTQ